MGATTITYNGVTISKVFTRGAEHQTLYDPSGRIPWAVKHTLRFQGEVHNPDSETFASSLNALKKALSEPRRSLEVRVNGQIWYKVDPAQSGSTDSDIADGPFPREVVAFNVAGGRAAFVGVIIEWHSPVPNSALPSNTTPLVLSHSWTQRFATDENNYTMRTIEGTIKFTSRLDKVNPDAFRCYVWPPLAAGYKRVSAECVVSSDGRTLAYQVTDNEGYMPLPKGILSGQFDMSIEVRGATALTKRLAGWFEGDKLLPKRVLVDAVSDLITTRFDFNRETITGFSMLEAGYQRNRVGFQVESIGALAPSPTAGGLWVSLFKSVTTKSTSPLAAKGRFKPINAYGSSLIYAAFQAMFSQTVGGNPSSASALAKASHARWTREGMIDNDADGYADQSCPVEEIEACELPDIVPDNDLITIDLSGHSKTYSAAQASKNVYLETHQSVERTLVPQTVVLSVADPTAADVIQQVGKSEVYEKHVHILRRMGEPPTIPVPDELNNNNARRGILVSARQFPLTVEPAGDGSTKIYTAGCEYVLRIPFVASDTENWRQNDLAFYGGSSRQVIAFRAGQSITPAANPQLVEGAAAQVTINANDGTVFV